MFDKDQLHAEVAQDLQRGIVLPAKAAALFDIEEAKLRQLSMDAYPLSLPDVAVSITTKQLLAALEEARGEGTVAEALRTFGNLPHDSHVVRMVAKARSSP